MQTNLEILKEKCEVRYTVSVEGEEWSQAQQKATASLASKVTVKGFRKGKAPLAQAAKLINPRDILDKAADKIVQKAYQEMLKDESVKPIYQPELIVNEFSFEKFSCTFVCVVAPEVELGQYKGIVIEKTEIEVTEEDVENEIKAMAEKNAELVVLEETEAAQAGDTVVIDFKGFVDGEAFDGGEASSFELVLGSNTFVPGFEDQLIGVKTNEDRTVVLTFPENYVANLSNKEATFEVHVNAIKRKVVPAIDEEFVNDLDIEGVDSVEQLRVHVKEQVTTKKTNQATQARFDELMNTIIGNATFYCHDKMLKSDTDRIVSDFEKRLEQQGFSIEDYLTMQKKTKEDLVAEAKEQAYKSAKNAYVIDKIGIVENITVTEEEVDAKLSVFATQYNSTVEQLKKQLGNQFTNFVLNVRQEKIIEFIKQNNTF